MPYPLSQLVSVQVPVEQLAEAWSNPQGVPQEPQSVRVLVLVSQPLDALPSQSAYPLAHPGTHWPPWQEVLPWLLVHLSLQLPQLLESVFRLTSQPLDALPSQLAKPASQLPIEQVPVEQLADALGKLHGVPQPPQLDNVLVLVSQPSLGFPLQLSNPLLQVGAHAPPEHTVDPWSLEQPVPQEPQWALSVLKLISHPLAGMPSQLP